MSYILEALRRAETERERKRRVPGLHAQPVPVVPAEEPGERRSKAWLWVVVGVSAGVLLPLGWRWWAADPAAEDAGSARTAVAGSVAPPAGVAAADAPAALVAAPAPEPSTTKPATPATPAAPAAPAAQERPHAPQAAPTTAKTAAAKPAATATPHAPATRQPAAVAATDPVAAGTARSQGTTSAPAVTAPATAAVRASAPEPRLRSLAELPEDLRRGVPALAFGGSVYSEIAAQRMVIFNGQVLREGDAVTDDLLLEQIRPRSAVMRVRGQRFEIGF